MLLYIFLMFDYFQDKDLFEPPLVERFIHLWLELQVCEMKLSVLEASFPSHQDKF